MVGATGFEPATAESDTWASDKNGFVSDDARLLFLFCFRSEQCPASHPCTVALDPTHRCVTRECCLRAVLETKLDHRGQPAALAATA